MPNDPDQTLNTFDPFRMSRGMRVGAWRNFPQNSVDLHVVVHDEHTDRYYRLVNAVVQEGIPGEYSPPLLSIPVAAVQQLVDDLWAAGFRPSDSRYSSEALAAKDKHIDHLWQITDRLIEKAAAMPVIVSLPKETMDP